MPADFWTDAARMGTCFLAVAAAVLPVAVVYRGLTRRAGEPLLPRPTPWRVPWGGVELLLAFVVANRFIPAACAGLFPQAPAGDGGDAEVRGLWVAVVAFPLQLAVLAVGRWVLDPAGSRRPTPTQASARLAVAGLAWVVVTPAVLAVHVGVNQAFTLLDWAPTEHPLTKLAAGRPVLDRVAFVVLACVAAPVVEEVFFRGGVLPWLLRGGWRVPVVLTLGVLVAVAAARTEGPDVLTRGPVLFAAALAAGGVVVRVLRRKRRTVGAVYGSAALFAAVHSAVWPSPVPLFLLGLALGWLAVRTRGVLVPAVVHALFNAVSVLYVLRGGAG